MSSAITPTRRTGDKKPGACRAENNKIYAHPLPLTFTRHNAPNPSQYVLGLFGLWRADLLNPRCVGVFDPVTCSVWVSNTRDSTILWRRGFFGKGDLSRSEPSWRTRQFNARKAAGKYMTSEEIREKRRAERKQFKLDRAAAIARAAEEAEVAFVEGRQAPAAFIPSGATWKPPQPSAEGEKISPPSPALGHGTDTEEDSLDDIEHLQLTLQEAFFLAWSLDCLTVLNPVTMEPMSLQKIWDDFQRAQSHHHTQPPDTIIRHLSRFDNPFLVFYAAYHYYRSLGWVVKGGVKFCVDYLLYKRGPVFHHAEFAVVVLPVYEDLADRETSPLSPFSWAWLSTINRVNSQVQKTLILAYVTIPAQSKCSSDLLASPACLAQYTVREVVVRRFIPARMRD
ncbi:Probable tRNA-splicing endonuclease subunit [Sparassis crispa]|uniref:tRNA-splicing endonuclease subunit Sen2 n=1 Tax=Sparassis crispa TaxID=139825 RepID=A0A401GW97_9APHY|nr:Probable tRNA-splicing endonuclease subunit [Sparassis crispa]GBE86491.1 Probable tRNA-splicing endonuclease subunit [Sparassis crispa]